MGEDLENSYQMERIESRVIFLGLIIATGVSLADSVFNFLSSREWVFPLIFISLLILLRWVDVTRRRVASIATGTPLRTYESYADFYSEAWRSVSRGSKTVYAVFSHAHAPSHHTAESRAYYAGTIKWARRKPGERALHRVIRLPAQSPDIQEWVDEQVALSVRIENYHVRVLRYPEGMELEGENFAVIDSSIVFLGFAIENQGQLKGFSIRDKRVARAFEDHFWELWRISKDVGPMAVNEAPLP